MGFSQSEKNKTLYFLILSSHFCSYFLCSCLLVPVPCNIVFACPFDLVTCPYQVIFLFFTMLSRLSCGYECCVAHFLIDDVIHVQDVQDVLVASIFMCLNLSLNMLIEVNDSNMYKNIEKKKVQKSLILHIGEMIVSCQKVFSFSQCCYLLQFWAEFVVWIN